MHQVRGFDFLRALAVEEDRLARPDHLAGQGVLHLHAERAHKLVVEVLRGADVQFAAGFVDQHQAAFFRAGQPHGGVDDAGQRLIEVQMAGDGLAQLGEGFQFADAHMDGRGRTPVEMAVESGEQIGGADRFRKQFIGAHSQNVIEGIPDGFREQENNGQARPEGADLGGGVQGVGSGAHSENCRTGRGLLQLRQRVGDGTDGRHLEIPLADQDLFQGGKEFAVGIEKENGRFQASVWAGWILLAAGRLSSSRKRRALIIAIEA